MTVDYGTDLACTTDLDDAMSEVGGIDVLAQALYRRLTTPRGALWQDPNYGLDVRLFLSKNLTASQLASIPSQIRTELRKDERVSDVLVNVAQSDQFTLTIDLTVSSEAGPFSLTISATKAAVTLVSVSSSSGS